MLQRKNRSWTTSNDETDSQKQSLLHRFFHHHHHISPHISTLYSACQNNDLVQVEDCLKNMKTIEIDHQYAPSNETVLHMATRNQSKEMIKTLLSYGIQRSLRNIHGQQAYHLAQNKEIEDLFQRPKSSRFTFLHKTNSVSNLSEYKNKCKSCSLINDKTFYEWELINENASQIALRFRRELKPLIFMNENDFKQKLYSIHKGYIKTRLQHISTADHERISSYFKRALYEHKPYYIITAYTICQSFTELLNQDLARNVIHDIKNGCSKFSCDCLYSTEDGTKSITNIFFYHPKFRELSYKGEVYRGIVIEKTSLQHYKVGSCIITTTFLSASKNSLVAQAFCDKGTSDSSMHSFFCIYEIFSDEHTALDISTISEFEFEDEVLILPYSAFLITNMEEGEDMTKIYLKEQRLTQLFDEHTKTLKSSTRLLEWIEAGLSKLILSDDENIRSRSKTMPM